MIRPAQGRRREAAGPPASDCDGGFAAMKPYRRRARPNSSTVQSRPRPERADGRQRRRWTVVDRPAADGHLSGARDERLQDLLTSSLAPTGRMVVVVADATAATAEVCRRTLDRLPHGWRVWSPRTPDDPAAGLPGGRPPSGEQVGVGPW